MTNPIKAIQDRLREERQKTLCIVCEEYPKAQGWNKCQSCLDAAAQAFGFENWSALLEYNGQYK